MLDFELDLPHLHSESGWLCLDFANTMDWHASEQPIEELTSYSDLAQWARQEGLISPVQAEALLSSAGLRPDESAAVLEKAIALREAIYHIFSASAHGKAPNTEDLELLNGALTEAARHYKIAPRENGFAWEMGNLDTSLEGMLWPVAHSAAQLLTSSEIYRVGECADDRGCGWLFFDTSKNRSRRWCAMQGCGNRAKARRHYKKARTG